MPLVKCKHCSHKIIKWNSHAFLHIGARNTKFYYSFVRASTFGENEWECFFAVSLWCLTNIERSEKRKWPLHIRYKKMKGYTEWHECNLHMLCSIYIVSHLILRYAIRINNMPEILCWYRNLWTFIKSFAQFWTYLSLFVIVRLEIETSVPFDSWSWEKMECDLHFICTFLFF